MALVAHWHLNGDTKDYSGNGYDLTNNGATVSDEGKIGKCYKFNREGNKYMHFETLPVIKNKITVSYWVNFDSNDNYQAIFSGLNNHLRCLMFANNELRFFITGLEGNAVYHSFNFNLNKWYHFTQVVEGKKSTLYVDGLFHSEKTATLDFSFSKPHLGSHSPVYTSENRILNGKLNDVRIYDHALSEDEVKEIAKAKILHWTFNENAEPTENLVKNRTVIARAGITFSNLKYNENGGSVICSGTTTEGYGAKGIMRVSTASNLYLDKKYSAKFKIKINAPDPENYKVCFVKNDAITLKEVFLEEGYNTILLENFTNATALTAQFYSKTDSKKLPANFNVIWSDWQVEEKPYATEFVERVRPGEVFDHSGFGNLGKIDSATSPRWIDKSKFGSGCYEIENDGSYVCKEKIKSNVLLDNNMINSPGKSITMSSWVKFDSLNIGYGLLFGWCYYQGIGVGIQCNAKNQFGFINYYRNSLSHQGQTLPSDFTTDVWYHVCQTFNYDFKKLKLYINGTLVSDVSVSTDSFNNNQTNHNYFSICNRVETGGSGGWTNFKGYFDDTRIYATALSEDDISRMYEAKIKDGVFHCNGIVEQDNWRKLGNNLLDYSVWRSQYLTNPGSSIPNSDFDSINGPSNKNSRVYKENPWGELDIVWKGEGRDSNNADAGWNSFYKTIDPTKKYRISVWVRREWIGTKSGEFYLGTNNTTSNTNNIMKNISSNSENTNPYFYSGSTTSIDNAWCLVVAYVYPHTYSGTTVSPESGFYWIDGAKKASVSSEFKFNNANSTLLRHRTYLYYNQAPSNLIYWYRPRIDCCDGTEPSIQDLIAGYEDGREVRPQIDEKNQLNLGEISEFNPYGIPYSHSIFETKSIDGALWLKVFRHRIKNNSNAMVYFGSDINEVLETGINNPGADKYSLLKYINNFKKDNGKIELLVTYPEMISGTDITKKLNRWEQDDVKFGDTDLFVSGYSPIKTEISGHSGLARSADKASAWFDHTPGTGTAHWWSALGCKTNHNGGIPIITPSTIARTQELWVRIEKPHLLTSIKPMTRDGILHMKEFNEID